LERATAAVLVLVILALGWVIAVAYRPALAGGASNELLVILILALLASALGLVSLVALLHTRS
jgi:hypothetical protein